MLLGVVVPPQWAASGVLRTDWDRVGFWKG